MNIPRFWGKEIAVAYRPDGDVAHSRRMVATLRKAGGRVRYSEYADGEHDVWHRAFAEPGLLM
jgi:hypothetical protein